MKAVSYAGTHKMSVTNHPKPKLKTPSDAILRVTASGICGSDLHMYDGRTPLKKGTIIGHGADVFPTAFHATDAPAFLESPANRVPFPAIEKEVLIPYIYVSRGQG